MPFNESEYLQRFGAFFRHADFSSSYKPVFLKSIMDIADYGEERVPGGQWLVKRGNDKLAVQLDFLAIRYAKYFWDMYYRFRFIQSHNPSDVNIHQFFRGSDQNPLQPPTLADLAEDKHRELRNNVIRKSIKPEVLPRLNKDLRLYEIVERENYIVFEYALAEFFRKYRGILIPATNYVLTRYLERINFSPRIAEKVQGKPARDYLTIEERSTLLNYHKDGCFYCHSNEEKYHIDHVIPFDYIFSTELFNTVPACKTCNEDKSNRLPTKAIFNLVIERNSKFAGIPKEYSQTWYEHLYRKCAEEYHRDREYFQPRGFGV